MLIRAGSVEVNRQTTLIPSHRIAGKDEVTATIPDPKGQIGALEPEEIDIPIVHADHHLIVVDKPAGLAVHPGAGRRRGTLVNALLHRFPEISDVGDIERPGIVHRLDIDTSGLMVVARKTISFRALSDAIRARQIDRRYTALVRGRPHHEAGIVDAPIGRDSANPTRQSISRRGREARTRYRVLETFGAGSNLKSLLEIKLETGRMHQIRVHMQAIGHPVSDDPIYGGIESKTGLIRQFLHAHRLSFSHPISGEALQFEAPLPEDLATVLNSLRRPS